MHFCFALFILPRICAVVTSRNETSSEDSTPIKVSWSACAASPNSNDECYCASTTSSSVYAKLTKYLTCLGCLQADPVQITTLPNKLRVVTEDSPGHFSSVGVYVDAGVK